MAREPLTKSAMSRVAGQRDDRKARDAGRGWDYDAEGTTRRVRNLPATPWSTACAGGLRR
ncbi:MAG: hypothetical protein Fur0040_08650 [Sideroxydans sp.]